MPALLSAPIAWLTVTRAADNGRACRDYTIHDQAGTARLQARAHPWRRDIVVQRFEPPHHVCVRLRRRLTFPLSGVIDVADAAGARLGIVKRNGSYRDGSVSGRFRDARTMRDFARESIFLGVMDALAGADGSTAVGSGPTAFVWLAGNTPVGTLTRAAAPFLNSAATASVDHNATRAGRIVQRTRRLLQPAAPRAWKLERLHQGAAGDERVVLAAALFAIELSHW